MRIVLLILINLILNLSSFINKIGYYLLRDVELLPHLYQINLIVMSNLAYYEKDELRQACACSF